MPTLKIFDEEVRRRIGAGSLSKEERIDIFMEMGELIADELNLTLVSFDPSLSFRDDHWNHTQISLSFAVPLARALVELRRLR